MQGGFGLQFGPWFQPRPERTCHSGGIRQIQVAPPPGHRLTDAMAEGSAAPRAGASCLFAEVLCVPNMRTYLEGMDVLVALMHAVRAPSIPKELRKAAKAELISGLIAKIQGEVQEVLLAIHEAEGDDETDAAPEQVDGARKIQNLSKEILRRSAVAPAENLDDEDDATLEPYELFRRIQLEAGDAIKAGGRLSDIARLAWRILRRARAVEHWHLDRNTVLMQPAAADPLVAANEDDSVDDSDYFTEMTRSRMAAGQKPTATVSLAYHSSEWGSRVAQSDLPEIEVLVRQADASLPEFDEEDKVLVMQADASLPQFDRYKDSLKAPGAADPMCASCLGSLQSEPAVAGEGCGICGADFFDNLCYFCLWCDLGLCASCHFKMDASELNRLLSKPTILEAKNDHKRMVQALREKGADINARDDRHQPPLHLAAIYGRDTWVTMLLEKRADINARDDMRQTPLHVAARYGRDILVQVLLEKRAKINARDDMRQAPLHVAARYGRDILVQVLLEKGADINAEDDRCQTPLHLAAGLGWDTLIQALLKKGAGINARDDCGQTPLHLAAVYGWPRSVYLLLVKSADINARDVCGQTPRHVAARYGRDTWVQAQVLLVKSADIDARDEGGQTPLRLAARHGRDTCFTMVLEKRADINARDDRDQPPLHKAAAHGHGTLVQVLRENGADINARERLGQTPLHEAAANGRDTLVQVLLEKSADITARDAHGLESMPTARFDLQQPFLFSLDGRGNLFGMGCVACACGAAYSIVLRYCS
eukprot:s468_g13.t1